MEERNRLEGEIIKIIKETLGYEVRKTNCCLLEIQTVNICDWITVIDKLQIIYGKDLCDAIAEMQYHQFTIEGVADLIL